MSDMQSKADHWRQRAEEARAAARALTDPEFISELLVIANGYDRLAERAEESHARKT